MSDIISRNEMLQTYQELCMNVECSVCPFYFGDALTGDCSLEKWIHSLPSAEPKTPSNGSITSVKPENMHVRTTDGLIRRQAAIDAIHEDADWLASQGSDWQVERMERDKSILKSLPSAEPERLTDDDFETIRTHLNAQKEKLCNQQRWEEAEEYQRIIDRFMAFASAEPEIIRCKDCKWFGEAGCAVMIVDDSDKPTEDDYCSFAELRGEQE